MHTTAQYKKFFAASLPIIALLLAAMLASPAFGQERDDWCDEGRWGSNDHRRACEVREYTMNSDALSVDAGGNGGVSVEGWDRNEILVRAKITGWADSDADAEDLVSRVTVNAAGDSVSADGPRRGDDHNWSVSFRVYVPRDTDLSLEAHNGGIGIEGVHGHIRFTTHNGGVHLGDLAGDVRGSTHNGGLHVELSGDRWNGEGLDVTTRNGGIKMSIPEGYNAELETGTRNGGFRIDFPVTVQGDIKRRLETTLGSGGPKVRVMTTNGGVTIGRAY